MITLIDHGHPVTVVARPLRPADAAHTAQRLHQQGIDVLPAVDERGVVHLWPEGEVSTVQEVAVLAAFLKVTDSPLAWHGRTPA